eukprot:4737811-Pyramimonas_sp.AAC.2
MVRPGRDCARVGEGGTQATPLAEWSQSKKPNSCSSMLKSAPTIHGMPCPANTRRYFYSAN